MAHLSYLFSPCPLIILPAADSDPPTTTPLVCEMASLDSVQAFCKRWKGLGSTLDVLVLNAGVAPLASAKPHAPLPEDGFEMTGHNYLGHFPMDNLLLPELEKAPGSPRLLLIEARALTKKGSFLRLVATAFFCHSSAPVY